jgi:hypothetical protein
MKSYTWRHAIINSTLPPTTRHVMLTLSCHVNDAGEAAYPSTALLAHETGLSERAVVSHLRIAAKLGWLSVQKHGFGGQRWARNQYYPCVPDGFEIADRKAQGTEASSVPCGSSRGKKALKDVRCLVDKGTEPSSVPSAKALNVVPKGTEPDDKKALNEVQSNYSLELSKEQLKSARRSSRVASHEQIRNLELPDGIPADVWAMWCEHREAKIKDAPWTRVAAAVSIKRLLKLAAAGQPPDVTVEEAVLRGWTGLFPVKAQNVASTLPGGAQAVAADWWRTSTGIEARAKQLGLQQRQDEGFMRFKARVFKAAGPGEWMEDMLRTVARESEERYDQLYAYFNDIPRDKNGKTEAA